MRTWLVHALSDGVGEATGVDSVLAALTCGERRGFEGEERHGWHKGFPVRIGIG